MTRFPVFRVNGPYPFLNLSRINMRDYLPVGGDQLVILVNSQDSIRFIIAAAGVVWKAAAIGLRRGGSTSATSRARQSSRPSCACYEAVYLPEPLRRCNTQTVQVKQRIVPHRAAERRLLCQLILLGTYTANLLLAVVINFIFAVYSLVGRY